jgi:SAM-dependent methyltransferase
MAAHRAFEDHYWWFKGLRHFTVTTLERSPEFQQLRRKPIIVLDAGCGTGANMIMLSRYGRVIGFDYLWESIQNCRTRQLPNICRASIIHIPFKEETFDAIASFDVLVCLEGDKDVDALRSLYAVCRPGGLLILNLAAFQFLHTGLSVAGGAVHRYTRSELKAKLEGVGFKILKLTYRNMFLYPLVIAVRIVKGLQHKPVSEFYRLPAPIDSFFYRLLRLEAWLSTWFNLPVGSSVFCLAQRPK